MYNRLLPLLPVSNLNRSILFYRDKLQFDVVNFGNMAIVQKDQINLRLYEFTGAGKLPVHEFYIYVTNLQDLYIRFSSADLVMPADQMKDISADPKKFVISDKDGHRLHFFQT